MSVTEGRIKVWDLGVRIFHWALVLFFAYSYISGEEEFNWHVYSGYVILGLITFRILWGVTGTHHARFASFVRPPGEVLAYARGLFSGHPQSFEGHNPLGGYMIIALLLSLLATGATGMLTYGAEGHGPLAGLFTSSQPATLPDNAGSGGSGSHSDRWRDDEDHHEYAEAGSGDDHSDEDGDEGDDNEAEEVWEELHEFFAGFTLFLVALHILGVLFAGWLHGENLIRAMVTGYKVTPAGSDPERPQGS